MTPKEEILFMDRPSWRSYMGIAVMGVVCTILIIYSLIWWLPGVTALYPRIHNKLYPTVYILPFIIILFFILNIMIQRYSHLYTITTKGIICRHGIIARNTSNVPADKITDFSVKQNMFQRILDVGNIYINTAGGPGIEAIMLGVRSPFILQEKLDIMIHGVAMQEKTGEKGNKEEKGVNVI